MVRTQVQLRAEQVHALKQLATEREVSLAGLLREAVDRLLAAERVQTQPLPSETAVRVPAWKRPVAARVVCGASIAETIRQERDES